MSEPLTEAERARLVNELDEEMKRRWDAEIKLAEAEGEVARLRHNADVTIKQLLEERDRYKAVVEVARELSRAGFLTNVEGLGQRLRRALDQQGQS